MTTKKEEALEIVIARWTKAVTDPGLGDDVGWLLGELDFFSQLANGDTQIFGLIGVSTPNRMQQSTMCQHLPGVLSHRDQ